MKRVLILVMGAVLYSSIVFAQEVQSGAKEKVLIVPLKNKADAKKYNNTALIGSIIFRSMYNFIGLIPSIDVPNEKDLLKINVTTNNAAETAAANSADIVIYGSYQFSGTKENPDVSVDLSVWDNKKKENVISKNYKSTTGADIFDTIDDSISNILKTALNIEAGIATINFSDFRIGRNEKYELAINNRSMALVTNTNFVMTLKVLPRNQYDIVLIRLRDSAQVLKTSMVLKMFDVTNVSYTGKGAVRVEKIILSDRTKRYSLFIDDKPANFATNITGLATDKTHNVTILDRGTNVFYSQTFEALDNGLKVLKPKERDPGFFHLKLYTMDRNFATLGADFFIGRYFWLGAAGGFSIYKTKSGDNVTFISPAVEAGYYLFGDMVYPLRAALGVTGRVDLATPRDVINKNFSSDTPDTLYQGGVFSEIEFYFAFVRPAVYYYFVPKNQSAGFTWDIAVGVKY